METYEYTIQAALFSIVGIFAHDFWVLRDNKRDIIVAQMHGLATSRTTGKIKPVGTSHDDSLRVYHFALDKKYAEKHGFEIGEFHLPPTSLHLTYSAEDSFARWLAAIDAMPPINALDLDYPIGGISILKPTINSNSSYRTLGEIMDLPIHKFPWRFQPGNVGACILIKSLCLLIT